MLDQLTNGQLQWEPLENPYDQVVLGPPENRRRYPIYSGRKRFPEELKKCFPGEEKAIDEYLKLSKVGQALFFNFFCSVQVENLVVTVVQSTMFSTTC